MSAPQTNPVFVWRAVADPALHVVGGRCIYCGGDLQPRDKPHEITSLRIEETQRKNYGKLLSEMTETDWSPFRKAAQEYNQTEAGQSHSMPEELEDEIDFFFGVLMNAVHGVCSRCGWWLDRIRHHHGGAVTDTVCASLRNFDLNSSELALPELRSHLSRHFSDVYSLSPRRFEELVGSVYSALGWQVMLTKQSRDGGVDLYCLGNSNGDLCIVECKRYAASKAVTIAAVDRLLGVAFRNGATCAHFVTTSRFTGPAKEAAQSAQEQHLAVDLVDAHELAQLFAIYSDPQISVKEVKAIFDNSEITQKP